MTDTAYNANDMRVGHVVLLKQHPCKVTQINRSKPGKHGKAKFTTTGIDIFTSKKHQDIIRDEARLVKVTKTSYMLMDINVDGYLSLMMDDGTERIDIQLVDGELADNIRKHFEAEATLMIEVQRAMNQEQVCGFREDKM